MTTTIQPPMTGIGHYLGIVHCDFADQGNNYNRQLQVGCPVEIDC